MKRRATEVAMDVGKTAAKAALGTNKARLTSAGAVAGAVATFSVPGMGLAIFGTAIALWWAILLVPFVLLGALVGNWFGLRRENKALRRAVDLGPNAPAQTPPTA